MTKRKLSITWDEMASVDELNASDKELALEAIAALKGSYAPYSKFHVGAAVRLASGRIVHGANQENAAFPSGLCAERTAMFAANANYPDDPIRSIALAGGTESGLASSPATPCGACRQVMAQCQLRAGAPMSVIMVGKDKVWKFKQVDDILPFIFDSI